MRGEFNMNDIFVYPLQNSKEYKDIINCINNKGSLLINGLLAVQKPHIAYSMYRDLNRQTIFITNSDLEAKKVYDDLSFYMKDKVEYIGFQDILFYHLDAKDRSEFSVVAPIIMTVRFSTACSRASCCDFEKRWISSINRMVRRS